MTADLVVAVERVIRCNACGADVELAADATHDPEDCTRGGGVAVEVHPLSCSIKGCGIQRSGVELPSRTHQADHMHWHLARWDKEAFTASAPAPAAPPAPGARAPRLFDRWMVSKVTVSPGETETVAIPAQAGAACVAVLAFCPRGLTDVIVDCYAGAIPMGAYVEGGSGRSAVASIAPEPGDQIFEVGNDGDRTLTIRIGVRWELCE